MPAEFPIEHLSPATLLAHPLNWGKHSDAQRNALASSLGKFGWLKPVIVNTRTGRIIDGHARVEHARNVGADTIPCRVVDVDEATEREMLAVIDRVGELRERDENQLLALLKQVSLEQEEPPAGWEAGDLTALIAAVKQPGAPGWGVTDPETFPDPVEDDGSASSDPLADGIETVPDPESEWVGMPDFVQEDLESRFQVHVNFKDEADLIAFEALVDQKLPRGKRIVGSIWYPKAEIDHVNHLGYASREP